MRSTNESWTTVEVFTIVQHSCTILRKGFTSIQHSKTYAWKLAWPVKVGVCCNSPPTPGQGSAHKIVALFENEMT